MPSTRLFVQHSKKEINEISKGPLAKADGIQSAIITTIEPSSNINALINNARARQAFLREEYVTLENAIKSESGVTHSLIVDRMKANHYQLEKVKAELSTLEQIRANIPLVDIRKELISTLEEADVRVSGIKVNINNKLSPPPKAPKLVNPMERLRNKVLRRKINARDLGEKHFFRIGPDGFPIEAAVLDRAITNKPAVPALLKNTESAKILSFAKGAGKVVGAAAVVAAAYDVAVENNAEYALVKYMESMKQCRTSQHPSIITALWGRIKQAGVTIGIHTGMDDIAALLSDGIAKGNFSEDVKRELRDGISYIKKNCPDAFAELKADTRFIDGLNDMDARTAANPLVLELRQGPLNWWQTMTAPRPVRQYSHPYDIRPFEGVSTP